MRTLDFKNLSIDIQNWIKNYIDSANADGVVVGLSGGIDSSVAASLCVNAIGKTKVIGLGLPCESPIKDLEDAKLVARHLGIEFMVIDLTKPYNQFLELFAPIIKPNTISNANIKPRLRMIALYYAGQSLGKYLVAGTGNRAELAIGYFTKYGDGGVDFEPLGMLYKSEVRELGKVLEIPKHIIEKPPSPGLWSGQTDEGEIGLLYNTIDEILYRMDYNLGFGGLNLEEVNKVKEMMKKAEHKLLMPPMYEIIKDESSTN
ncbi:MAG: NAD+ synthase [Candidatus Hodarchaeota archaeon]